MRTVILRSLLPKVFTNSTLSATQTFLKDPALAKRRLERGTRQRETRLPASQGPGVEELFDRLDAEAEEDREDGG